MKAEFGAIRGFNLIPGINIIDIIRFPASESLTFILTVRGERRFKELAVTIERTGLTNWTVVSFREI
jgi:hypothetical protein